MIIKNGNLVLPDRVMQHDLYIDGDRIGGIGTYDADGAIDASGLYVCPGFVDIHTHGGYCGDFMDATDEAFDKALCFHGENGTTTVLATSLTAPVADIEQMISKAKNYKRKGANAKIAGVHLEGPYLSYNKKGAQNETYLRVPDKDPYDFICRHADIVKTVTLAPELAGAAKMTEDLTRIGIKVCGGHDDGSKDDILPVIRAGLTHCTHLWCAMSTVAIRNGVRNVGLCELGLIRDDLTAEMIADNHHIPPELAQVIFKCKGADRLCLVSDSLRMAGMPEDGTVYTLGSEADDRSLKIVIVGGVAKLFEKDTFAGSIQPLRQMVKNLHEDCGFALCDVVKMASLTPARIIGEDSTIGSIATGKKADLCILDKNFDLKYTIIDGKITFSK